MSKSSTVLVYYLSIQYLADRSRKERRKERKNRD